jgi:hypothetical protein
MSLPSWWQDPHFSANKAAAFTTGGGCFREQPENASVAAKSDSTEKLVVERSPISKQESPTRIDDDNRDAADAVRNHRIRVEKGKDSSRWSLTLTSAFTSDGALAATKKVDE